MTILVEAYAYQPTDLDGLIDSLDRTPAPGGRVKLNYVGYLAEAGQKKSVIILPKVFLNASRTLLGGYSPEQLLTLHEPESAVYKTLKTEGKLDFLFRFSVWLYRAIRQFRQRHPESDLPERAALLDVSDAGDTALSELELVMALVRFHRDNNSLLTYIKRFNTAQRHTVSWSRTVSRQQPILQNGRPVYTEPVVKQKHVQYDEELLVLYLSTLDHLQQQYGFRLELNPLYERLSARAFAQFQKRATRRLKEIRSRYFSDKLVRVWTLLYQYYDRQERLRSGKPFRELLLVRDFNIVFEDMIDYLLSDPKEKLPTKLKDQPDGKRVDHIYAYRDLIRPDVDQIYHIGDSKYYKAENEVGDASVFKQFTYARNVIQHNIDLLNRGLVLDPLRYRDDLTEGYNPTPNFFISALVEDLDFSRDGLVFRKDYDHNRHFENRLFDRDTLLLQAYNINFLYVLNAYVAGNKAGREGFRKTARSQFRERMVGYLNEHYDFFTLTPKSSTLEAFVSRHFRQLIGRLYRPSGEAFQHTVLLAVSKKASLHWNTQERPALEQDVRIEDWFLQ
ncbi:LlaJI family restriction endonuclease [Larkinella punicea]|uniref:LlaJI family restriction endonuclease n=1 Tax=Larkinella punicea TaxID=2315727 RepID=A0A368JV11_9BACT|nr:LlaJI family restriction endonuclease [Larkinella punicea]RCR71488.1 LlaJI family restriction endonuclease [Larkinella punicea]